MFNTFKVFDCSRAGNLTEGGERAQILSVANRAPHLDGLRGAAALAVVLFHLSPHLSTTGLDRYVLYAVTPGWIGVDIFFVLSGFLITGILLDSRSEGNYFKRFYLRRAFRILPLYYAYLVVVFGIVPFLRHPEPQWTSAGRAEVLSYAFYVQNFFQCLFPKAMSNSPTHLWSLAIEEQFYLVWPLLVLRLPKASLARLAGVLAVVSIMLRCILVSFWSIWAGYWMTFSRLEGLCLGAILAVAVRGDNPYRIIVVLRRFGGVLLAIFLLRWATANVSMLSRASQLIGSICAAGIAAYLVVLPGWWRSALTLGPLQWLGRYSYALYVLQYVPGTPLERLNAYILTKTAASGGLRLVGVAIVVAIDVAAARLSWAILEGPMMRLRDRLETRLLPRPIP